MTFPSVDQARDNLSHFLGQLIAVEQFGSLEQIEEAEQHVRDAERLLVETELRLEGGWKP